MSGYIKCEYDRLTDKQILAIENMLVEVRDNKMNIQKSLTYFMKLDGYTQADISRLAILNPATISLVINGHRDPTCKTIQKLADLFEVKVSEFIAVGERE